MNDPSLPTPRAQSERHDGTADSAFARARFAYRALQPPDALEATLLARFGELRVQRQTEPQIVAASGRSRWQRLLSLPRLHPAFAGGMSLCVLVAFASPWWVQWVAATPESTTPFMLVAEPSGKALNVAQMVRVSVSREAMLDFGIPVPPQQLQEPVRAEMLLGARGELLAVRFVDNPPRKRFLFN
jgi:hypothetical protein